MRECVSHRHVDPRVFDLIARLALIAERSASVARGWCRRVGPLVLSRKRVPPSWSPRPGRHPQLSAQL
eukprot:6321077-Prymnesium_polylepis.1